MAIFSKKSSPSNDGLVTAKEEIDKIEEKITEDKKRSEVEAQNVPMFLLGARISEKANHLIAKNKYVFNVKKGSNKVEIKKAVERTYKVKVIQVNIVNNQGKNRRYGNISGRTSGFKKAIITLKKGDKIEGMTDKA